MPCVTPCERCNLRPMQPHSRYCRECDAKTARQHQQQADDERQRHVNAEAVAAPSFAFDPSPSTEPNTTPEPSGDYGGGGGDFGGGGASGDW